MVLINGSPVTALSVTDRAIAYGDGLFTTLAVSGGVPLLWSLHLERLHRGCQRLGIAMPDDELLRREVAAVADGRDAVVKILISRGSGGRGYGTADIGSPTRVVSAHPLPAHREQWRCHGVRVATLDTRLGLQPLLAGIKTLNRLEQVLARREVEHLGVDEGVCLDLQGRVVEATAANLWWWQQGHWFTPALEWCGVAGVMRALLMEALQPTVLPAATIEMVLGADAVMMTNAVFGVVPVRQLDHRVWDQWPAVEVLQQQLAAVMV